MHGLQVEGEGTLSAHWQATTVVADPNFERMYAGPKAYLLLQPCQQQC